MSTPGKKSATPVKVREQRDSRRVAVDLALVNHIPPELMATYDDMSDSEHEAMLTQLHALNADRLAAERIQSLEDDASRIGFEEEPEDNEGEGEENFLGDQEPPAKAAKAKAPNAGAKSTSTWGKGKKGPKSALAPKQGETLSEGTPLTPEDINRGKVSFPKSVTKGGEGSGKSDKSTGAGKSKEDAKKASRSRSDPEEAADVIKLLVDVYVGRETGVGFEAIFEREVKNVAFEMSLSSKDAHAASALAKTLFKNEGRFPDA